MEKYAQKLRYHERLYFLTHKNENSNFSNFTLSSLRGVAFKSTRVTFLSNIFLDILSRGEMKTVCRRDAGSRTQVVSASKNTLTAQRQKQSMQMRQRFPKRKVMSCDNNDAVK